MSEGDSAKDPGAASGDPASAGDAAAERACATCGTPLQPDQDWCVQCGAGAPSGRSGPGWRSAAAALAGAAVLALGAAAAAYAALNKSSPTPPPPVTTVAQTPPVATTSTSTATTTSTTAAATASEPTLPTTSLPPPKIPSSTQTPTTGGTGGTGEQGSSGEPGSSTEEGNQGSKSQGSGKSQGESETETGKSGEGGETGTAEEECETSTGTTTGAETEAEELEAKELEEGGCPGGEGEGAKSAPLVFAANAASTYDPNGYPETGYLGPELAIDGVTTTAWTAAAAPELAPKVQAGLLIDLQRKRRIAKVGLISRTLGMTVEVFGTTQREAPKSIESSGWKKLSGIHLVEERNSSIVLKRTPKIRQLLIWVLKAPEVEAEAESEEASDSAAINEVALYESE
jgi:hypothetical protein